MNTDKMQLSAPVWVTALISVIDQIVKVIKVNISELTTSVTSYFKAFNKRFLDAC